MSAILSIDTSTATGSVAVHANGQLLVYHENHLERSHSENLAVEIDHIFKQTEIEIRDIDAVAISKGPGSYTGLRIGVALAKGICYASGAKLISINTLESMAQSVRYHGHQDTWYCPMIDARRMEVYCQVFDHDGLPHSEIEARIIDQNAFKEILQAHRVLFFGNGSRKCREIITHPNARFIDDVYPMAKIIGQMAHQKFINHEYEDVAYFEPFYLKEFIAKRPSGKNLI